MHRKINRFGISFVALIVLVASFSAWSTGQPAKVHRQVDKSTILYLFQHLLFKSLNSKLDGYQSFYDQDYQEEDNVYDAFDVFSKVDATFESLFVKWITDYSEFYMPYVARAKYYCAYAREARGHKWAIDKDQIEYQEMERYFSRALADIQAALKKNDRLDVCYTMMVEISMATADGDMKQKALAEALKNHPYAYRIRLKYLQSLTPRLGGSYELMAAYIDTCMNDVVFNPKLKELAAFIPAEKGNVFSYLGKYGEAVKMYTEALIYSKSHIYYASRGDAYVQLQDYEHALHDYDQALELSPNDPDYLSRKAKAIMDQKNISNAPKTNQYSNRYESNPVYKQDQSLISERTIAKDHLDRANNLANAMRYEEAITEYSEVIRLFSYEFAPYYNRAICYSQLHNDDAALQDYLRVVELQPDYSNAYMRITMIYANRDMYDDALNSINKLISLNPNNGEALFTRARIYERKGSNIKALQDMRQACAIGYQPACRYYNQVR